MTSSTIKRLVIVLLVSVFAGAVLVAATGCAGTNEKEEQDNVKDADWHYKMGAGYFESKEIQLAIRELRTAVEMDAEHHEAHYLLGFIYMGRRDYSRAIQHFKETLRLKPDYHFARNNLGTVYLSMERWREAADIYEALLEEPLYTTPELAHNNLGWAYFKMRRHSKAIEHFNMALFLKPQMCLAHNNLGRTHESRSRYSQAEQEYRKAIRKCPGNYAEPHFNLAKLLQDQGDPSARDHFEKCLEIEPESNLGDRCRQYLQVR
jgi:type IV pilus assembly protein PilF